MKRLLTFSGIIAWVVLIGFGIDYVLKHPNLSLLLTKVLAYFGGVVLLALIVWITLRIIHGKDWMLGFGKQVVIGNDLIKATDNFLGSPNRETIANLLAHLVYRFTRLGLIGLLLAMIPIWLLYQQNTLLQQQNHRIDIQNELITNQNNRLDQQTYLQEAERRSSLVFLFSNVMDAIDRELKEDVEEKGVRDLTPQLIGRIIALSNRLKPYQYLERDKLISKPLSPERGQLLVTLVESKLDTSTLNRIYEKAMFSESYLYGANLSQSYLRGVKLFDSYISYANFQSADFRNANLSYVDFSKSNLSEATFCGADLTSAILWHTDLRNTNDLSCANLTNTNLSYAYVDLDFLHDFENVGRIWTENILSNYVVDTSYWTYYPEGEEIIYYLRKIEN